MKNLLLQVKLWKYFAWSFPLIFLAAQYLLHVFGFDDIMGQLIVIGGEIFFTVSVIWWWWAVHNIANMIQSLNNANKNLEKVADQIGLIRKDLK